ncbi:MAG: DUF1989 domain-containing protein [Streptosporangiaceae bacterium]
MGRGDLVRVVDVEGHQVGDMWAIECPNCRDNFLAAVAAAGITLPVVPDPANLFQDSGPQPDGRLVIGTAASQPGQAITFRVRRDLVFALTSCSVDYPPLNSGRCTALRIEIAPAVR